MEFQVRSVQGFVVILGAAVVAGVLIALAEAYVIPKARQLLMRAAA